MRRPDAALDAHAYAAGRGERALPRRPTPPRAAPVQVDPDPGQQPLHSHLPHAHVTKRHRDRWPARHHQRQSVAQGEQSRAERWTDAPARISSDGLCLAYNTVNILVVILTIPWLFFFTTVSSGLLDDNVVTHVMCIANLNPLDDSVVTYDERVVN